MISFKKSIHVISSNLFKNALIFQNIDGHFEGSSEQSQGFSTKAELVCEGSTLVRCLNFHFSHFEHVRLAKANRDAFIGTIEGEFVVINNV